MQEAFYAIGIIGESVRDYFTAGGLRTDVALLLEAIHKEQAVEKKLDTATPSLCWFM